MATRNLSTSLPWQSLASGGNALQGLGGDPQAALGQLGQNYNQQYQAALGMNQSLFNGMQTGYEALRSGVDEQYQGVLDGYSQLYGDVLGRIAGTNETNLRDINSQYNAQSGAQNQAAVSRGLGNSTVQQNMQRGVELDRARAITGSQNQFAQLGAGYAASIGGNRLQAQQQGIGLGANLGQAQLGALERVSAPYPDAGMYGSLAQMYGGQIERNQGQTNRGLPAADSRAVSGRPGSPSPWGSRDPTGGAYSTMGQAGGIGGGFFGGYGGGGYGAGGYGGSYYGPGNVGPEAGWDSPMGGYYQDSGNSGMPGTDYGGWSNVGGDYYDGGGNFDYGSFADYASANPGDFGGGGYSDAEFGDYLDTIGYY